MSQIVKNIKLVFSSRWCWVIFGIVVLIFLLTGFFSLDYHLALGNAGSLMTHLGLVLHFLVTILFALFVVGQVYRFKEFGEHKKSEGGKGIIGGLLGALITGCPSCSIGLASYLGLSGLLSLLPRHGLELKILAILLLLRSNYSMYKDLQVCKIKVNIKR